MNVRKGKMVASVGEYQGSNCTLAVKTYDSINQAKKANGLNATTTSGQLPPNKAQIDAQIVENALTDNAMLTV